MAIAFVQSALCRVAARAAAVVNRVRDAWRDTSWQDVTGAALVACGIGSVLALIVALTSILLAPSSHPNTLTAEDTRLHLHPDYEAGRYDPTQKPYPYIALVGLIYADEHAKYADNTCVLMSRVKPVPIVAPRKPAKRKGKS